jgi:(2Fe-2S) ferredoxin
MPESPEQPQPRDVAAKLGIGSYHRHVFLCAGPSCCTPEDGLAAWEVLKKEIKDRGLSSGANACYRTKVGCLRICCAGPTMVVYPEGIWYHGMSADRIPELVQQHLVEGRVVEGQVIGRNPLPQPTLMVDQNLPS